MTLTMHEFITRGPGALKRRALRVPWQLRVAVARSGSTHHCVACGSSFGRFLPFRAGASTLSPFLIRAGYAAGELDNHQCPVCWVGDRERHLLMYFEAIGFWRLVPGARVLHFAPEAGLRERILACVPLRYVAADLFPADERTVEIDVTAIPEPDSSFDLVICNHVLEHVDSVETALSEMFRVLAPGGTAILQTPLAKGLTHTFEDSAITSDADRLFFYGQEDHARLFGRDVFDRIGAVGFEVSHPGHAETLGDIDPRREGVLAAEDLILAKKPAATRA